ncbi:MAG: hypothetical protein K0V04_38785, partial [Deltaproteobacteria bacterium]|nr:hypothetical protein [Deltaproteobacteria bacterium]
MARSWILAVSPWLLAPMHGCGLVDLLAQTAPSTLEPAGAEPDPAPRPSPVDVSPDAAAVGPQASTAAGLPGAAVPDAPEPALVVVVNGQPLDAGALASLRRRDIDVEPGRYWYDGRCGAWGREGEGVAGFLPAGLVVGGTLSPDASGGDTEVFINRRELTAIEVAALARLGTVVPGRYWLDGNGNWGLEA